jgi:hypothetical protein
MLNPIAGPLSWTGVLTAPFALSGLPSIVSNNQIVASNQSVALSSIFSVSGTGITQYQVWFGHPEGGYPALGTVTYNGTPIATDQAVPVSGLSGLTYTGPATQGADIVNLRVFNGVWSGWTYAILTDQANLPHVIGSGETMELTGAYSGTITFAAASGTLKLDNSSTFRVTIGGQLAIGDVIDLTDITAGAGAAIGYTGNNSPGTLTVGDGTRTATIDLLGNYSLGNFTPSSDGRNGTSVVDPPLAHPGSVRTVASVAIAPAGSADAQVAAGRTEYAMVASMAAAFVDPQTESTASGNGISAPVAVPPGLDIASTLAVSGQSGESSRAILAPAPGRPTAAAARARDNAALPAMEPPQAAVAREIVSPDDLILAIRKGDIALKIDTPVDMGTPRAPWLFDEARGTFDAPQPEQLTIVIDSDDDAGLERTVDGNSASTFTAEAVVVPEQSWFGAIRMAWMQPVRGWWWR